MSKVKSIDYLSEDPSIPNQKFALVSIVGPHMPQKCDVWGLKVRGTAESLEKAKSLSQRLLRMDNNYDIYTVEVGKFFPLEVEPHEIGNVEYQNSQLNDMVKQYLENKEMANEMWHQRKNEMIQDAIKEGKSQDNKPEHPISVLQRIRSFEDQIKEMTDNLESLQADLELSKTKFTNYSDEEKSLANKELNSAISEIKETKPEENTSSLDDIRRQLMDGLNDTNDTNDTNGANESNQMNDIISRIQSLEKELTDLQNYKQIINEQNSPNVYKHTVSNIGRLEVELSHLKEQLNNKDSVNQYINSNYTNSKYDNLF
jgi:hypothetical protein